MTICTLGQFNFDHFLVNNLEHYELRGNKPIFKIMAQGAYDRLFYAEFRTVFLFSVNFPILGAFRFEILKNQRGDPLVKKI